MAERWPYLHEVSHGKWSARSGKSTIENRDASTAAVAPGGYGHSFGPQQHPTPRRIQAPVAGHVCDNDFVARH